MRFVDGNDAYETLRKRYSARVDGLNDRERTIWEMGYDHGCDAANTPLVASRARAEKAEGERDALAARCERLARLGRASVALSSAWYALSPDELDPYQREEEEARADCESHGDLEER